MGTTTCGSPSRTGAWPAGGAPPTASSSNRHDPNDPASLASDAVHTVLVDAGNRVWIGTANAGLDMLEPASGHIEHRRHDPNDASSLIDGPDPHCGARPLRGAVGGHGSGARSLAAPSSARSSISSRGRQCALPERQTRSPGCSRTKSGALWVGSFDGGLDRLDREGQVTQSFVTMRRRPASLGSDDVRAILEDQGRSSVGRHRLAGWIC